MLRDNSIVKCPATPSNYCLSLAAFSMSLVSSHNLQKSMFDTHSLKMSLLDYLKRLETLMNCSDVCFVMAGLYLRRYMYVTKSNSISPNAIHRLLLVCVVIAAKHIDDVFYSNNYYASVGCVLMKKLNLMEWHFLELLDYRTYIRDFEYTAQAQLQLRLLDTMNFFFFPLYHPDTSEYYEENTNYPPTTSLTDLKPLYLQSNLLNHKEHNCASKFNPEVMIASSSSIITH